MAAKPQTSGWNTLFSSEYVNFIKILLLIKIGSKAPRSLCVYVSNLSYDTNWQDLKSLFQSKLMDVPYVELMYRNNSTPTGKAVIELGSTALVDKAVEHFDGFLYKDRKLCVKKDKNEIDHRYFLCKDVNLC